MASTDTLAAWSRTLDEIGELYCHVLETVSDLPEPKVDLAGSTSKGAPPPLPGGIKLALAGPHSVHAEPDGLAHPGVLLGKWCAHVARKSRSIPPGRTRTLTRWQVELIWLRERLHWIEDEDAFQAELRAVHGLLRNVCNADRPSQAEQVADRWVRGETAMRELQALWNRIPWAYMLTKRDIETIWPDRLTEPLYDALTQWKVDNPTEPIPRGHFPAGLVRQYIP